MSDYAPPKTYYDPYSRSQKPVLTEAQVKTMWPYKEAKHKRDTMDDAMPNLEPADAKAMADIEATFQQRRMVKLTEEEAYGMAQMELFPEAAFMQAVTEANIASAPERGVPSDAVNLPNHYARFKIEPIRFLVENFGAPILVGKIVKYSLRYDAKNGLEDLRKARRCMDMLIKFTEGDPDWWKAAR